MTVYLQRRRGFSASSSQNKRHHWSAVAEREGQFAPALTPLFIGISYIVAEDKIIVALAFHDHTYLLDFTIEHLPLKVQKRDIGGPKGKRDIIADFIIKSTEKYERDNHVKFVGAAMPKRLVEISPRLCSRLWLEMDVVPIVISYSIDKARMWYMRNVDEQADSMARKCGNPSSDVGFRGCVMSDSAFRAHMVTLEDHQKVSQEGTWNSMIRYASILKAKKIRIAFFSSTPQGGGVALMRHALRRFSRLAGVDLTWYVPKPRPGVFRSTKDMHNILQGVNKPNQRLTAEDRQAISDWIAHNAESYWLSEGGPLRPPEDGGAHVVVVDDPQMPTLIPLIKKITPNRPVIFRSHIQIRSDLVEQEGTPQKEVWDFLWEKIRYADLFISHPVPAFVPREIPDEMVAYMPATTDWLDGLNKRMGEWASKYYFNFYNRECSAHQMTTLRYPDRQYILQIARFDPAKGIPTVLDAYAEFRKRAHAAGIHHTPQLVVVGNTSIDDPDASLVFDEALNQIEDKYPELLTDISIMRLPANDLLLNCLLEHAHVVLQLSTREGFEVKVSEALLAGVPVIATRAGGIPIQVKEDEDAFLVEPGDYHAVAKHLMDLFSDEGLWRKMSHTASTGVSDEVGTAGNALCWYYLAAKLATAELGAGKCVVGNRRWINDLAREEAGFPYSEGENRLPRSFTEGKT
ncbi:glycosyltransferase family 4 protein [Xylariaceae sp. FL0594]|nr:glycosyltransferase family 4 protein [Xylariaceae sp. FL0594]